MPKVTTRVIDKGATKLLASLSSIRSNREGIAGWPATGGEIEGTPIPEYMRINNDGSEDGRIPARPFMDFAFSENLDRYARLFEDGVRRITRGASPDGVLLQVAAAAAEDIKRAMLSGPWEPNAESTVERKGSSRPLVDTGAALGTVQFEVRDKR